MATPSPSEWISKDEAAKLLRINARQLQHRAAQGYIEKRFLPRRPNERQARVAYARRDVEALLSGNPNHCQQVAPASGEPAARQRDIDPDKYVRAGVPPIAAEGAHTFPRMLDAAFIAVLQQLAPPPRVTKAWLTLQEAADYSGLPAPEIVRLLHGRYLYASGRGPVTWRIQRESLDQFGRRDHLGVAAAPSKPGADGFDSTER